MRILFFAGGSYVGGLEIVTLSLMQELQAQGHMCFAVVSGWSDGQYMSNLAEAGIPHQSIKLGRLYLTKAMWNLDSLLNFPAAARKLRKVIQEFRPDVVILGGIEFSLVVLQVLPKQLPVVLYVHAVPNKHWTSWMGLYVLARTVGTLSVSNFVRRKVVAATQGVIPAITVHNGVRAAELVPASPSPKLRIGIIGQLIPMKKHDVLVDAVGMFSPEERAQLEVRIYGANTTAYAQGLAKRIDVSGLTDCFRWMGFVISHAEIYSDLDVVVAVAVDEAFGLTVIEAGNWALPVIAARAGGFPETVRDGETGLLVEPDDPDDLAKALRRLMHPSERQRLGRNARRHVLEHFSVPRMARSFIAALSTLRIGR